MKWNLTSMWICVFVCRANTLSNAVSTLSNTGMSFSFSSSRMDEKEKQQALEEEQARLQALKVDHDLSHYVL